MPYVDGFVLPLPKKHLATYRRMARLAGKVWKEHGALEYRECVGDDFKYPGARPWPKLMKTKPGETVVFAWIVYRSKGHRNRVNRLVMKDPRMRMGPDDKMPFDMKRMMVGGFKVVVDL